MDRRMVSFDEIEQMILAGVSLTKVTRDEIAVPYAEAIRLSQSLACPFSFRNINKAIMNRWSESALEYIKQKAWKIAAQGAE